MNLEERKQFVREGIKYELGKSRRPIGGQSCGLEILPVILKSEDLDVEITINHFRQNFKNKEYGMMLFDLIIEDLIK